jgi:MFS family permease
VTGLVRARANAIAGAVHELDRSLLILAAVGFVSQLGIAIMLPLLPLFAIELGGDPTTLGLLTSAFAVTNTVGQLSSGFLAERFEVRRLIPSGEAVYAAANGLMASVTAATPLIALRAIAGLGAGTAIIAERIYLAAAIPEARLAFANGVLAAAASAGTVAGPAVGGLVAAATDLRIPFVLVAVTSAIAATLAWTLLPPVAADVSPVARSADADRPETTAIVTRTTLALLIANFGLMAGFGAFITTFGAFGTTGLGLSTAGVGLLFSAFGLGDILLGPWLGRMGDRRGRRRVAILACLPIAAFVVAFVGAAPTPLIYLSAVLAGGGVAAFSACWYALLTVSAPRARRSRVLGVVSALSNLGIVAGGIGSSAIWSTLDLRLAAGSTLVAVGVAALAMWLVPRDRPPSPAAV